MKKILTAVVILATTMTANAQFYASATGGYALGVPSANLGEQNINGNQKVTFGTYGEGFNTQLRVGYFFNKTWGVDVSTGYLHGAKQTVNKVVNTETTPFPHKIDGEAKAQAKAYGLALSVIYNFTDNFYGRFGVLTKIGGKTQLVGQSTTVTTHDIPLQNLIRSGAKLPLPQPLVDAMNAGSINPSIKQGATIETSYTEEFKGKMPFGTIAALGYKYNITDNLSVFGEVEYMNIGVKRDYSEVVNFEQKINATITGVPTGDVNLSMTKTLKDFENNSYTDIRGREYFKKTTYVDEIPANNTDASKELTQKASYSSLGINIGVTYTF